MPQTANMTALTALGISPDSEFLALLDASIDCIKVVDGRGCVVFMNANGMCAMDIDSFPAIDGERWSDMWPPDAQATVENAVERALDGESVRFEAFCPTAHGRPRWWDVTVSPMASDGSIQQLLSISRDITDRVRREQRAAERERRALSKLDRKIDNTISAEMLANLTAPTVAAPIIARVGPEATRDEATRDEATASDPSQIDRREARRLETLYGLDILDRDASPELDRLTRLAARLSDAPTALVSLVDRDRQFFLSRVGLDTCETPRSQSFCSIAIKTPDAPFIIEDASTNPLTRDNPLVTGEAGIRSYLGIPLVTTRGAGQGQGQGQPLGALCIIDVKPRTFSARMIEDLTALAGAVVAILERDRASTRVTRLDIANAELKHRMGNVYAQVASLVGLASAAAPDKDALATRLRENISVLSKTQSRIAMDGEWVGIDLCSLTNEVFAADDLKTRIHCDISPNFDTAPNSAFLLTLALQELATNSRKHGLLRETEGQVTLNLRTQDDRLIIEWRETSPPRDMLPAASPKTGFGKKLLTRIVPMGLGGTAELDVWEDGMSYRLDVPRARVEMG